MYLRFLFSLFSVFSSRPLVVHAVHAVGRCLRRDQSDDESATRQSLPAYKHIDMLYISRYNDKTAQRAVGYTCRAATKELKQNLYIDLMSERQKKWKSLFFPLRHVVFFSTRSEHLFDVRAKRQTDREEQARKRMRNEKG